MSVRDLDRLATNVYLTSDLHFDHEAMATTWRNFGSVDNMNRALIEAWNDTVPPSAEVWVLGDFAFSKEARILELAQALHGRKHLVLGNHDKLIQRRPHRFTKAFESIQLARELKVHALGQESTERPRQRIWLSHYAHRVWKGHHRGAAHAYGHSHGNLEPVGRSADVGIDSTHITSEPRPVSATEFLQAIEERPIHVVDHHVP